MSRNVITVEAGTPLDEAWRTMRERSIKALPVVDRSRRIVGIVTMADFLRAAGVDERQGFGARMRDFIKPEQTGADAWMQSRIVGQIMTRQVRVASADRHAMALLPLFTEGGHHHIPVIDEDKRLVGIITQSDFVRALARIEA
jgi:CBS domain-containing membrane protein